MRNIVYVDGSVGVGKSTFIKVLKSSLEFLFSEKRERSKGSHFPTVDVLPEPLHRDWTSGIVNEIGYEKLLEFLIARKIVAINKWSSSIASDGLQELETNVLIVERSLEGDRRVNSGYENFLESKQIENRGEIVYRVFLKSVENKNEEQLRLNMMYNNLEIEMGDEAMHRITRILRPKKMQDYYIEAARVIDKILSI